MTNPGQNRPDGRLAPPNVLTLRRATRALRLHLDALPIDFDLGVSTSRISAGLVFASARQRFACAESLIGAGFGGTAMGSVSRSLFVDGLRWLWIGSNSARLDLLDGELLLERSGICRALDAEQCTCPTLRNWLEPIEGLLPVSSPSADRLFALPSEQALLSAVFDLGVADNESAADPLIIQSSRLLNRAELRGAAHVLAHAGHGNYLGLQSSLAEGGAVGFDLRFDHEALFMQMASAGVVAAATGSSAIARQWWPVEVDRTDFLERAVELSVDVATAAIAIHGLSGRANSGIGRQLTPVAVEVHARASVDPPPFLPVLPLPTQLIEAAEGFYALSRGIRVNLVDRAEPALHPLLAWGGAHSGLDSVFSTYDQPGGNAIAPFGARALLEEAARTHWRYSAGQTLFEARATQFFDEFRARRIKAINRFQSDGIGRQAAEQFFSLPGFVEPSTITLAPRPGRQPIPSVTSMIRDLGVGFAEPGWLVVAYAILSQATHATPLGLLQGLNVSSRGTLGQGSLTPQMLALSLDVACLAGAVTLGVAALALTDVSDEARDYRLRLSAAAANVHDRARLVHGLD